MLAQFRHHDIALGHRVAQNGKGVGFAADIGRVQAEGVCAQKPIVIIMHPDWLVVIIPMLDAPEQILDKGAAAFRDHQIAQGRFMGGEKTIGFQKRPLETRSKLTAQEMSAHFYPDERARSLQAAAGSVWPRLAQEGCGFTRGLAQAGLSTSF